MKTNLLTTTLITFAMLLTVSAPVQATTYYVATTGSDSVGCGTQSSPCATITYASNHASNGGVVQPGDTVSVASGTYNTPNNNTTTTAISSV